MDSNLQLDRTHLHEIWTLCSQSHSKETNSHKWIDQTVLQTRHHSSLRESPKAMLERQSNSDNQTDKSEPGL